MKDICFKTDKAPAILAFQHAEPGALAQFFHHACSNHRSLLRRDFNGRFFNHFRELTRVNLAFGVALPFGDRITHR